MSSKLARQWRAASGTPAPSGKAAGRTAQGVMPVRPGQAWETRDRTKASRVIRITGISGPDAAYVRVSGPGTAAGTIRVAGLLARYRMRREFRGDGDEGTVLLAVSPSLTLESGERPGFPGSRTVTISTAYGGRVIISLADWQALMFWARNGVLK